MYDFFNIFENFLDAKKMYEMYIDVFIFSLESRRTVQSNS